MKRMQRVCHWVLLGGSLLGSSMRAEAWVNNRNWDGGAGSDTRWTNPTNWSDNTVPGAGDLASFTNSAVYTITVDDNVTVSDLEIARGSKTFTTNSAPPPTLTVLNDLTTADQTWSVATVLFTPVLYVGGQYVTVIPAATPFNGAISRKFTASGNTFAGGMDIVNGKVIFATNSHNNTFAGGIRVRGLIPDLVRGVEDGTLIGMGHLSICGLNTTFGQQAFQLDRYGRIQTLRATDFSNITNIVFNGGILYLGDGMIQETNTFPLYANGFDVQKGAIWFAQEYSLGLSTTNEIRLGSRGSYGTLRGNATLTNNGIRVERPIVLNGNGGIIWPHYVQNSTFYNYNLYMSSVISGTGELLKLGYNWYYWNGTDATVRASTYSGGTRILSGAAYVYSLRTLGTGPLSVDMNAYCRLGSSTNVAVGAPIYVGAMNKGTKIAWPACLELNGTDPLNWAPNITADSCGILAIVGGTTGPNFNNWLQSNQLGNGQMILAGSGTYTGTNLVAGADGTIRLGARGQMVYLNSSGTTTGALHGPINLEIGLPYNTMNSVGQARLQDANTYSGTTTVHLGSTLFFDALTTAGQSALGDTNAPVVLNGGNLGMYGTTAGSAQPVEKGTLRVEGSGRVTIYANTTINADLSVKSFSRSNACTLVVNGYYNALGDREQFFIRDNPPVPTNGMVTPYMVGPTSFLTYDPTIGFTNATYSNTVTGTTFPAGLSTGQEIVNVMPPATGTSLQDDPYVYALRMTNGINANGAADTITLASGGLIINEAVYTSDVNWVFGSVSGTTTTLTEALMFVEGSGDRARAPRLSGTIAAAGLTKFGPGMVRLWGNNNGSLHGPIVINDGYISITNWVGLGDPTNTVLLNGGQLYIDPAGGYHAYVTNPILIGPNGGQIQCAYVGNYGAYVAGVIADQDPANAGPVRFTGRCFALATNTYTGGTILTTSDSAWLQLFGGATLGSGPIRVEWGGWLLCSQPAGFTNDARLSLEMQHARLQIAVSPYVRFGSLEGSGYVYIGDYYTASFQDRVLELGTDNSDSDFYGPIWEAPQTRGTLIKTGNGTQTLWGDCAYRGDTLVNGGTLAVNGVLAFSTNVVVNTGATLSGKGTIETGPVRVNGGVLSGSLVLPDVYLNSASTLRITLNGTNAVANFSQLTVTGSLNLNSDSGTGATLDISLGFVPEVGQQFLILNNVGGSISGQFASGRVASASYNGKTYHFAVDYAGGDGNDIVLTALPVGTMIYIR